MWFIKGVILLHRNLHISKDGNVAAGLTYGIVLLELLHRLVG